MQKKRVAIVSRSDNEGVAGHYLRLVEHDDGRLEIRADRKVGEIYNGEEWKGPGVDETFDVTQAPGGGEHLQVRTGHYVRADAEGNLLIDRKVGEVYNGEVWNGPGADETFRFDPSPFAPHSGGQGPGIQGRLRVEHGRLRDDAGFVNYQAISEFCLPWWGQQGRWDEVERRLSRAAEAGRNAVRLFCSLSPQNGGFGPVTPYRVEDVPDGIEGCVRRAEARGMRSQLNVFADAQRLYPSHEERRHTLVTLADRYRGRPSVWFRIANEARQNGWSEADHPQLGELAMVLATVLGHRDFAISDFLDGDTEGGTARQVEAYRRLGTWSNILVLHPSRKHDANRVRWVEHLKGFREIVDKVAPHCAGIFDEPIGASTHFEPGRRENRAPAHVAAACTAACLGMGYTYHYISEQNDGTPGLDACALSREVPTSPDYRFTNANLGGSWVTTFDGYEKVRPCHNGSRGFAAGIGFHRGGINVASGWTVTDVAHVEADGLAAVLLKGSR